MAKKKIYAVEAWKHARADYLSIRLGTLHYSEQSGYKPAAFGLKVSIWDLKIAHDYTMSKAGWDFVQRIEFDKDTYSGIAQAYIDCPLDDPKAGVYISALHVVLDKPARYMKMISPTLLEMGEEIQQQKMERAMYDERCGGDWHAVMKECLILPELFYNALKAFTFMTEEKKDLFFKCLLMHTGLSIKDAKDPQQLRDFIAAFCVARFTKKANSASAAFIVESLDFTDDPDGSDAMAKLMKAFEDGDVETLELPANFEP